MYFEKEGICYFSHNLLYADADESALDIRRT